jgi:hypothetical protein
MTINNTNNVSIAKYYPLPQKVNSDKLITLLKKQENQHTLISNVYDETVKFLNDNDIFPTEVFIPEKPPVRILTINNVALFIVEDYTKFNTNMLPKKYVENLHFAWVKKNFRVIWIKKFEWEDLRKRNVLQSLILHACKKTKNRVFARNTYAEIIPSKDLREFFNLSSFYGYRNASFAVCLKDKKTNEILMAMNFGHPYYGKNKYGGAAVECIRAASKPFTIIVGGMSKLMKFMIDNFGSTFKTVIYYIDSSHYNSGSMGAVGFKYSHFAGGASHNVWLKTGSMFMRTPALHQEIMFLMKQNEIIAIPDVGNETFIFTPDSQIGNAS